MEAFCSGPQPSFPIDFSQDNKLCKEEWILSGVGIQNKGQNQGTDYVTVAP